MGPWNKAFRYAVHVQERFAKEFAGNGLTISAGLAVCKPKFPIQRAAQHAEELLAGAKDEGCDRIAAFGQIWPWHEFPAIDKAINDLITWSEDRGFERGWLAELLELAEAASTLGRFRKDIPGISASDLANRTRATQLAPARLAYQRARKYRHPAFRRWVGQLEADLAGQQTTTARYLPAIARIALAAARYGPRGGQTPS